MELRRRRREGDVRPQGLSYTVPGTKWVPGEHQLAVRLLVSLKPSLLWPVGYLESGAAPLESGLVGVCPYRPRPRGCLPLPSPVGLLPHADRCPRPREGWTDGRREAPGPGRGRPTSPPPAPRQPPRAPLLWPCRPWAGRPPGSGPRLRCSEMSSGPAALTKGLQRPSACFAHRGGCQEVLGAGRRMQERAAREAARWGRRECTPGLQPGKSGSLCGQLALGAHDPRAQ